MTSSVIISTRNRTDELVRCLESIAVQTCLPDEVLIIDANDIKINKAILEGRFPSLSMTIIHSICSLTSARNIGINVSYGDIVFFLDDDVFLERDFIAQVTTFYEQDTELKVGGVHGLDKGITYSWLAHKGKLLFHRIFFMDRTDRNSKLLPSGFSTMLDMAAPEIRRTEQPIRIYRLPGGYTSYRRSVFDEFMFDERFEGFSQTEDVDFSHRVAQKYALFFLSTARAEHKQNPKHTGWYKTERFYRMKIHSQCYLFHKYLAKNPLHYFSLIWSWVGLLILFGIYRRNRTAWRGILQGIWETLRGDPQRGGLLKKV